MTYVGVSNDPCRRTKEHIRDALHPFSKVIVYYANKNRKKAMKREKRDMYRYPLPYKYQILHVKRKKKFKYNDEIPVVFTKAVKKYLTKNMIDYRSYFSKNDKICLNGN